MQAPDFVSLQQSFQTLIATHATPNPQAASAAAGEAAQQWLAALQQSVVDADAAAKRCLAGKVVLLMYYGLFDVQRTSSALAEICPRCEPVNLVVLRICLRTEGCM